MTPIDINPTRAAERTAIDTLARTLWAEAYSETVRTKEALASVIMNRVRFSKGRYYSPCWGKTVVEACLAEEPFRCWQGSPEKRRTLMLVADTEPMFIICRRIASRAVRGGLSDPTSGATMTHRLGESPEWLSHADPTLIVGDRKFYRLLPMAATGVSGALGGIGR